MKLGDVLLRLAQGRRIGKTLGHRFAGHAASETELGIMPGVVVFGATRLFSQLRYVPQLLDLQSIGMEIAFIQAPRTECANDNFQEGLTGVVTDHSEAVVPRRIYSPHGTSLVELPAPKE